MKVAFSNAVAVGLGGFLGALGRWGLSGLVHRWLPRVDFPIGTLAVNLSGCLAIGLLVGLADVQKVFSPQVRAFALIGLLGGYTTFSTFVYETFAMARDAEYARAATNIGVHVIPGLALAWVGYAVAAAR